MQGYSKDRAIYIIVHDRPTDNKYVQINNTESL